MPDPGQIERAIHGKMLRLLEKLPDDASRRKVLRALTTLIEPVSD